MEEKRPKVGIGLVVMQGGKILLGQRKNAHGAGQYAGPGGHLEFGESFEECAKREASEETGIEIENVRFLSLTNFKIEDKHYVDIGLIADWKVGEPQVLEPEKCAGWGWHDMANLPQPLFGVVPNYVIALKTGKHFYDA